MDKLHTKCIRCGKQLKSQVSKELGFGPVCWVKWNNESILKPLFVDGKTDKEKTDGTNDTN